MQKAYRYSVLYFILFSLLLLGSSILLFEERIGFSYQEVLFYYQGNPEEFTCAKTASGLLKIILPHIFAFGLFVMVVLHFLVFTKLRDSKQISFIIYATFLISAVELFIPFLIINGFEVFVYVKLFSFFIFEALIVYILWLLFSSILKH